MPGTSPAKVSALLKGLRQNPGIVRAARGLNALTGSNLFASAFELLDPAMSAEEWAGWMVAFAEAEAAIDAEEVLRDINEDRAVAGFPEVRDVALVDTVLADRRRHFKDVTLGALERVPSNLLVDALTRAVTESTADGEQHAPLLIDEIIHDYGLKATDAIEKGAVAVGGMVDAVRAKASAGTAAVSAEISRLEHAVASGTGLHSPCS